VHLRDNTRHGTVAKGTRAALVEVGVFKMSLDATLTRRIVRALSVLDERGTTGPRLVDDAVRLWRRVKKLLSMELVPSSADAEALELACYALQLPFAYDKSHRGQQPVRTRLKDRAVIAVESLPRVFNEPSQQPAADESLLERTIALLEQIPERLPKSTDARLLADAINLEDFGVSGLVVQTIQLCRQGDGLAQLIDGAEKRELYGYWDARLKDGFHFEQTRRIAQARLEHARAATKLLSQELMHDES
jgi:hypothetical protein